MAAASTGPYQSRIFNFVHQQSRRVSKNIGSAFRHLQVATSWSIQVLLYPIYLLFQSTESAGKLHSSGQKSQPQLPTENTATEQKTPPKADQAIQQVLRLVNAPLQPVASSKPLNFLASLASRRFDFFPIVQGIATQLSTRTLVLITAQNETLDILTPQQQQKLQQQIIGEVANYWSQRRLADSNKLIQPSSAITFLDRTVTHLESLSEAAIALSFDHRLKIQALIWAAIDYFFGKRGSSKLEPTTPQQLVGMPGVPPTILSEPATQPIRPQLFSNDIDSWLTLSDLFGSPKTEDDLSRKEARSKKLAPAPEWIETQATTMGYVKHPLEQLLEWLDYAVLWLEELLVRVVQWMQQLKRGK